uniref:Uncharacterized protein n=1 Tax=Physcomitrium patens TaxID=3218 RepID=A0A2K1JQ61_PHYPA|nr:hypothetical protein PHYPA_016043 [Physcomitrium patens]
MGRSNGRGISNRRRIVEAANVGHSSSPIRQLQRRLSLSLWFRIFGRFVPLGEICDGRWRTCGTRLRDVELRRGESGLGRVFSYEGLGICSFYLSANPWEYACLLELVAVDRRHQRTSSCRRNPLAALCALLILDTGQTHLYQLSQFTFILCVCRN